MLETQPPPHCTAWRIQEQNNHWHARRQTQTEHGVVRARPARAVTSRRSMKSDLSLSVLPCYRAACVLLRRDSRSCRHSL